MNSCKINYLKLLLAIYNIVFHHNSIDKDVTIVNIVFKKYC